MNGMVANRYETERDRLVAFICVHAIFHPRFDRDVLLERLGQPG